MRWDSAAASPPPSPTPAPRLVALTTTASLAAVALQPSDTPNFFYDGTIVRQTPLPSDEPAEYSDIWEKDTPLDTTLVVERLATFDTSLHAQAGSFAPYQAIASDATVVGLTRLTSLGLGDADYTLSYQLVVKLTGEKFQAFEESAVVGTTVVDITVLNSSNFVTVNDAAYYARLIVGRVASAQH